MLKKANQQHFGAPEEDSVYCALGIQRAAFLGQSKWKELHPELACSAEALYSAYNEGGPLMSQASSVWRKWITDVENGGDIRRSRMMAVACQAVDQSPKDLLSLVLSTGSGYDAAFMASAYPDRHFMATDFSQEAVAGAIALRTRLNLKNLDIIRSDNVRLLDEAGHSEFGGIIGNWMLSGCADPGGMVGRLSEKAHGVALTESPVARWRGKTATRPYKSEPYFYFVETREFGGRELMVPKVCVNDISQSIPRRRHLVVDTTHENLSDDQYDSYLISREQVTKELSSDRLILQYMAKINGVRRELKEKLGL